MILCICLINLNFKDRCLNTKNKNESFNLVDISICHTASVVLNIWMCLINPYQQYWNKNFLLGMVVYVFSSSSWEAEWGILCKGESSLVYPAHPRLCSKTLSQTNKQENKQKCLSTLSLIKIKIIMWQVKWQSYYELWSIK